MPTFSSALNPRMSMALWGAATDVKALWWLFYFINFTILSFRNLRLSLISGTPTDVTLIPPVDITRYIKSPAVAQCVTFMHIFFHYYYYLCISVSILHIPSSCFYRDCDIFYISWFLTYIHHSLSQSTEIPSHCKFHWIHYLFLHHSVYILFIVLFYIFAA